MENLKSGKHWVAWANTNALNSRKIHDLKLPYRNHVVAFISALEKAGAKVKVKATRRNAKRAYLFHWSWRIYLKKCKPSDATRMSGVEIIWDHGDDDASVRAAGEMVIGFGLVVPPASELAPSLSSNHISGLACDISIKWDGVIEVIKKDGSKVKLTYFSNSNLNIPLHKVGKSYGVIKLRNDEPHWSFNGR